MTLCCLGNSYLHSREFESTEGPSEISGVRAGTSVVGLWKFLKNLSILEH